MEDPRRTDLRERFARHTPLDAEEADAVAHLLMLLDGERDPFARTTLPTHVTASAVVLDVTSRTVLLHLHRRLDRWLQPGGHIDPGEPPADAAVRETIEETGVGVAHPMGGPLVLHLDEHPGPDGHVHLDLRYLLLADRSAPPVAQGETTGSGLGPTLRWVTPDAAQDLADRSLARALDAASGWLRGAR
jgi:8-oxo-dGTP pyrophosphatase MutT (NUDIX family)